MIILDTNVVSEPMRTNADRAVRGWLDRQSIDALYLTATSLAELLVGIAVLPTGKRRDGLDSALAALIARLFGPRILPFDQLAAREFAVLVGRARARGHAVGTADGQIAAIATARGFAVATRDSAPFDAAGVPVINPWTT